MARTAKPEPVGSPAPSEVREAREAAGLTQTQAGAYVHTSWRTWQKWEAESSSSARRMKPDTWELFTAKLKIRTLKDRGALSDSDLKRMGITLPPEE